jgi:RNA recognition motif-containing protein
MSTPDLLYDDPAMYCTRYQPSHRSNFVSISNLALGTTTDDIRLTFKDFGLISHCFIASDRPSRALVVFLNPSDAALQAELLDGAIADGQRISVRTIKEAELGGLALLRRIT